MKKVVWIVGGIIALAILMKLTGNMKEAPPVNAATPPAATSQAPVTPTFESVAKDVWGSTLMKAITATDDATHTTNLRVEFKVNNDGKDGVEWSMANYLQTLRDKQVDGWTTATLVAYKDADSAVYGVSVERAPLMKMDVLTADRLKGVWHINLNRLPS